MAKISISMPDELLDDIDALAAELHRSRSGFVAEAPARHVADLRAERERRERIGAAILAAREIAKRVPPGRDTMELIREDRDTAHGEA